LSSDNELMTRVKRGDLDQLAVLYERYNRVLFGFFFKTTLDARRSAKPSSRPLSGRGPPSSSWPWPT